MSLLFPAFNDQLFADINKVKQMMTLYQTTMTSSVLQLKKSINQCEEMIQDMYRKIELLTSMMNYTIKQHTDMSTMSSLLATDHMNQLHHDCVSRDEFLQWTRHQQSRVDTSTSSIIIPNEEVTSSSSKHQPSPKPEQINTQWSQWNADPTLSTNEWNIVKKKKKK